MGGHQERARSAIGGTATPQDRQSSVVGGLSPSPANHGVCGARGRPWGSLDPPRLCPGCAAQWVTQLGDTGRLNPPDVCFPLLAMGRTLRPREPAGVPCLIPSPAAASHSSGAAFPTPGTWMRGGLGCSMGAPPPLTSSPARAVAKRPNSATSLYTAPWNPRCSSWRTKSLHGERVSTTPTPTPPSQPRSSAQSALSALRTAPDCPIPTQGSPGPLVPRAEQQCGEQVEVEPDQGAHGQHQQHHAQNVSCTEGGWAYGQLGTPPAQRTRPSSPVQMEGCTPCPAPLTRHGRGE